MYSFSYLEPACFSMSSSNSCFLRCIQVSQEAGQVIWYVHLLQNFPHSRIGYKHFNFSFETAIHFQKGCTILHKLYYKQYMKATFTFSVVTYLNFIFNLILCFLVLSLSHVQLFCNPEDCSPPGSSVHGIFQARIPEWVTISFSRWSSKTRDWLQIVCIGRWVFYHWATREALFSFLHFKK